MAMREGEEGGDGQLEGGEKEGDGRMEVGV